MSGVEAIRSVEPAIVAPEAVRTDTAAAPPIGFGAMLTQGVHQVEEKVRTADAMVRAFALDDSIPVHQVTIALEQARLAVELALQVRTRVLEGYREIMNMQL